MTVTSEANGAAVESDQPKGDLFSSMKNQMSSWLSKKEVKEETEDQPEQPKEEPTDKAAETEVEPGTDAAVDGEADKEGFGSGKSGVRMFCSSFRPNVSFDIHFQRARRSFQQGDAGCPVDWQLLCFSR